MSKPRVDPTFGISSVDVLIPTERHPACRWREAQPGSCKERENLAGDAKGKGSSGPNRKAESTDAPWESRNRLRNEVPGSTLPFSRHRCHRAGLEGSRGWRELPRVLGYFSSASYFSPDSYFRLMYVMNRIRSASAAA